MDLPSNFDKYKHIINYCRKLGYNCLSTNEEVIRFLNPDTHRFYFIRKVDNKLEYEYLDMMGDEFIYFDLNVITEEQYKRLSSIKDEDIKHYLQRFFNLPPKLINQDLTYTIKNNSSKIVIAKNLFHSYCKYSDLLAGYDVNEFTIDVKFDDLTSKYFIELLTDREINPKIDDFHLKQLINLIEFLNVIF